MSDTLYVYYRPSSSAQSLPDEELQRYVKESCAPLAISSIEYYLSTEDDLLLVEPFLEGRPLRALLSNKRKRGRAQSVLNGLLNWGRLLYPEVGLIFRAEYEQKPRDTSRRLKLRLKDLMCRTRLPKNATVQIVPDNQLFWIEIEVRLRTPLHMPRHEPAVGFFRTFGVTAHSLEEAKKYVTDDVEADDAQVRTWNSLRAITYVRLPNEVKAEARDPFNEGVWYRTGRVYFPA